MGSRLVWEVEDIRERQKILDLVLKSKKIKISYPKGGYDWIDLTITFKNMDVDFYRIYKDKQIGTYMTVGSSVYQNDSLFFFLDQFKITDY